MTIVLSRLDRIGDLVLSTPAIASVRRSWPEAHITLVCSPQNAVVADGSPDVDTLVTVPAGIRPRVVGERFAGRCDLAIALAPRAADFELIGATRARRRLGYTYVRRYVARLTARLFLTSCMISEADPQLCERDPTYVVRHEVDQLLALVERAGASELVRELRVAIDAECSAVAAVPANGIAFHLGDRWFRDGSTIANVIALLRELRRFGRPVVVTHGAEVRNEAAVIASAGVADAVVGRLPFAQWAAVFARSALVVTVDTGATHVASATGRPTVVAFEHRYYRLCSQEWAPYGVPAACVRKPAGETPAEQAALREAITQAVESLLPV